MKKLGYLLFIIFLSYLLFQGLQAEIYYPWKDVYIGSLEGKAWSGLILAPHPENGYAFRLKIEKGNEVVDGEDIYYIISEVGSHSPDGQYARIKIDLSLPFNLKENTPILLKPSSKSDTLIMEWCRHDERTVIGRIKAPEGVILHLVHYFPWNLEGKYAQLTDGQIKGECSGSKKFQYLFWADRRGYLNLEAQKKELTLSFSTQKQRELYFAAGVGEDPRILRNFTYKYKNKRTIDTLLKEEEKRYNKKRVKIDGLYKGVAKAITNNLFWMTLYQPHHHRMYSPAGRTSTLPQPDGSPEHWTIFGWNSFLSALEVSIESSKHAKDIIKSVLGTQYSNGNIPHWRGRFGGTPDRSQPPVGSYVVYKLFQRLGDTELLDYAYPYLKKWHAFWKAKKVNGQSRRDGNGDGLLEWGSDSEVFLYNFSFWEENVSGKSRATKESGQEDLPNWDDASFDKNTGTLNMNCIDLNSLYTLDAWCLAQIANILNKRADYRKYMDEYKYMKDLINRIMWDEREGFYFDRHWDGKFSTRKAASNFYPLIARIPDQRRAMQMLRHLLSREEFWGDYVIPTISRDDPSFKDQKSWRGTVWPSTNYFVYQGLKLYQFDVPASELAEKSAALFMRSWENYQLCPESFDSRTGESRGGRHQSWGPLLALIGLEEYLDFTPWEGFRFGMIAPENKGKISRISIQGRHYEVEISPSVIKLKEEGKEIVKANGSAVFRRFLYSESEISFEVKSLKEREIKVKFLTKGKYELLIDEEAKRVFEGKSVKFKVPEGKHAVNILLLEKKE